MNIFCNDSGKILGVNPEPIYQNSAGVNIIRFIGQFPTSAQVLMAYKLPNGDWLPPKMLAFVQEVEVAKVDGGKFGVWEGRIGATPKIDTETGAVMKDENGQVLYDLDYTITQYSGTATIQFYVYAKNGPLATEAYTFNIEKGVPMEFPELGDTDDLKQLFTQILAVVTETRDNFNNLSGKVSINTIDIYNLTNTQKNTSDKVNILEEEVETLKPSVSSNTSDISNLRTQQNDTSNAVEIIKSEIQGLRNDFKNEEHFRGWVTKNSEFETLKGDANDFAYSAESGTVWIYNNDAWQNSGEKVPGDGGSGVASNETPLMDGTASAGTSDAYARGDHRHPSDNNKLNVVTGNTPYNQVYAKGSNGQQFMLNVSMDVQPSQLAQRRADGTIFVPTNTALSNAAISKYQADNSYVTKQTAITQRNQAYVKTSAGNNEMFDIDTNISANTIVRRTNNGDINVGSNPTSANVAVNANYVSNNFLAKPVSAINGVIRFNAADGTTSVYPTYQSVPPTAGGAIPVCKANGRLVVGTPVDGTEAVNLGYIAPVDCSIILGGTDSFVKRVPAYLKNEPESYVGACCVTHNERHVIMGYDQDNAVFIVYNTANGTTTEYDDYTIE